MLALARFRGRTAGASRRVRLTRVATWLPVAVAIVLGFACGDSLVDPTIDPDPPITEDEAIEIAKAALFQIVQEIEFYGYEKMKVRVGAMSLRRLQELTESDLYTPDSPRMRRQIWAVQIGGTFDDDPNPYPVEFGYGIVGVDAENGDIWLRARYDREILVEP